MDGDESSMEGRTRGDGTFRSDCRGVAGCLYVRLPRLSHVRVRVRVLLRANVDDCVRGE